MTDEEHLGNVMQEYVAILRKDLEDSYKQPGKSKSELKADPRYRFFSAFINLHLLHTKSEEYDKKLIAEYSAACKALLQSDPKLFDIIHKVIAMQAPSSPQTAAIPRKL